MTQWVSSRDAEGGGAGAGHGIHDYYSVLGVEPGATRRRSVGLSPARTQHHLDVSKEPDAEERFKSVSEAYEVLGNAERRASMTVCALHIAGRQLSAANSGGQGYTREDFEGFGESGFSDFFNRCSARTGHGAGARAGGFTRPSGHRSGNCPCRRADAVEVGGRTLDIRPGGIAPGRTFASRVRARATRSVDRDRLQVASGV